MTKSRNSATSISYVLTCPWAFPGSDWPNWSCDSQRHDGKWPIYAEIRNFFSGCAGRAATLKGIGRHLGFWATKFFYSREKKTSFKNAHFVSCWLLQVAFVSCGWRSFVCVCVCKTWIENIHLGKIKSSHMQVQKENLVQITVRWADKVTNELCRLHLFFWNRFPPGCSIVKGGFFLLNSRLVQRRPTSAVHLKKWNSAAALGRHDNTLRLWIVKVLCSRNILLHFHNNMIPRHVRVNARARGPMRRLIVAAGKKKSERDKMFSLLLALLWF